MEVQICVERYVRMLSGQKGGWTVLVTSPLFLNPNPPFCTLLCGSEAASSLLGSFERKHKKERQKAGRRKYALLPILLPFPVSITPAVVLPPDGSSWLLSFPYSQSHFSLSDIQRPAVPLSEAWVPALLEYSFNLLDSNNPIMILITLLCLHNSKQLETYSLCCPSPRGWKLISASIISD